ncbi:ornithine carbamoyltransferase [Campylobacter lari]|nr:ornithine carbamoyltransferase [Campylobacter lari]MCV3493508.1 ornithine carbamoyltransferase [Campylobacter lari]MCV3502416.1 ornithine carbamoyltransferase [Campylobacter lari]MCV3532332.1 ornithine carbamoyltransferase [Campylobacter lari]MCV3546740.1 ornithine carbamoyltransferase [Campylobacter lari]
MKIALECKDLILEKTLEITLKDFLVLKKDCDFLVCDEKINTQKPQFIINKKSNFLSHPFNIEELLNALNDFNASLQSIAYKIAMREKKLMNQKCEVILEQLRQESHEKIDAIFDLYKTELKNLIKEENNNA